ncbi:hypothetical protein GGTG_11452 [Gaeumannomyces tritici R3-111a-1]|uniref:Uncharacterized protein n=1 Tax=Gaeumannomyces tritici (strain R3-111a-1) TaxID=644352 RepID=J3PD83_GAET3|nr:hypothetical protein GGTG_11452 [Gaeumannomyces tritici R3-111a-1]EJT70428.1 hypothetical protein GGTG_11452 [Gaeumannomyces tritici R3-111a-1]
MAICKTAIGVAASLQHGRLGELRSSPGGEGLVKLRRLIPPTEASFAPDLAFRGADGDDVVETWGEREHDMARNIEKQGTGTAQEVGSYRPVSGLLQGAGDGSPVFSAHLAYIVA